MAVDFKQPKIDVRERLNSLDQHHHDDRYLQSTGTLSESPTVSVTGTITVFKQVGGLITLTGEFSGWTSGAIATLSEAFRPTVDVVIGTTTISTTGTITPTVASERLSGNYT